MIGRPLYDDIAPVVLHKGVYSMDDISGRQRTAALYAALCVVFFTVSIGIACAAALLIRSATGHQGIHDSTAIGGTTIAFVIAMWITGDFIMPRLLKILPTSLAKSFRSKKQRP